LSLSVSLPFVPVEPRHEPAHEEDVGEQREAHEGYRRYQEPAEALPH
jgi:hypothetical protein